LEIKAMVRILIALCMSFVHLATVEAAASEARLPQVVSYSVWKHKKIDESKAKVNDLKHEIKRLGHDSENAEGQNLKRQLVQAEESISVAKQLTADDYVLLYLAPNFRENPKMIDKAAKSLSRQDISNILEGYVRRFQGGNAESNAPLALAPASMMNSAEAGSAN
jgi:hypothetical protein